MSKKYKDTDPKETQEWIESIDDTLEEHGQERTRFLLKELIEYAQSKGARLPFNTNTPFINTILPTDQPKYPGDRKIERRIKSIVRWNAMDGGQSKHKNARNWWPHIHLCLFCHAL